MTLEIGANGLALKHCETLIDSDKLLHDIIGHIYDASCDSRLWIVALKEIARLTRSKSVVLLYQDHTLSHATVFASYGIKSIWRSLYHDKYKVNDPSIELISSVPMGELVASHMLSDKDALYQSDTYKEFYHPQGIEHFAGTWLFKNEERSALIGFHREHGTDEYEPEVLSQVKILVNHLQKALHIHRLHSAALEQNKVFATGMDNMQTGLVFLNNQAEIHHCNSAAKAILTSHPAIGIKNNSIYAYSQQCQKQLKLALHDVIEAGQCGNVMEPIAIGLHHPNMVTALPVLITPMNQTDFFTQDAGDVIAAVMVITDPERMLLTSPELLSTLYSLTYSEAEVAIHLANAMSVKEIADFKNVKVPTVRTQVQSVFMKLSITTQAELIKLLLCSPFASVR